MDRQVKLDRTVNLNTIIASIGFIITIGGGVFVLGSIYSTLQTQNSLTLEFQKRQEDYNKNLEASRQADLATYNVKLDNVAQSLAKTASIMDQQTYQIAQLQKKDEETDARLGRMSESYGNKFTEIQSSLASINTQVALVNQSVAELKQIISPTPTHLRTQP